MYIDQNTSFKIQNNLLSPIKTDLRHYHSLFTIIADRDLWHNEWFPIPLQNKWFGSVSFFRGLGVFRNNEIYYTI